MIRPLLAFLIIFQSLAFADLNVKTLKLGPGFPLSPVKNQGSIGFCWANSTLSFLEGRQLSDRGEKIVLSARYIGLNKVFYEIYNQLPDLIHATEQRNSMEIESHLSSLKKIFDKHIVNDLDEGGWLESAQEMINSVGVVPEEITKSFSTEILQPSSPLRITQDTTGEDYIALIETKLSDLETLKAYLINGDALFVDLAAVFKIPPIYEDDEFEYDGKTYTPLTFAKDRLGINKDSFKIMAAFPQIKTYERDFKNLQKEIAAQLARKHEVPVTFNFFGRSDDDMYSQAYNSGQLTLDTCNGHCSDLGGHVVSIVNTLSDKNGAVVAYIVKNSWGDENEATAEGLPAVKKGTGGFLVMPVDYLKKSFYTEIMFDKK